ncbi:hypothetical protein SteCoe_14822 [Stentor coeruleus]|uniref:Cyclic nucleotide-binding domain-containing protein n=1 Tax=Stentor coeruleus TaxID=5963 RepID=A0A1R2C574_9CILI|nr:hypothetical protein SteCoe_14822 [Stentor coeruleus]
MISFHKHSESNYGLDQLKLGVYTEYKTDLQHEEFDQSNSSIPEFNIMYRLSKFTKKDFYFRWSVLIFVCNLYNMFTVPYLLALIKFPNKVWLALEIFCEFAFVADIYGRFCLMKTLSLSNFWHLNYKTNSFYGIMLIGSSVPYTFLAALAYGTTPGIGVAIIRCSKLIRIIQIRQFLAQLELLFDTGKYFEHGIKIVIVVSTTVHYLACLWIFAAKIESWKGKDNWIDSSIKDGESELVLYIGSLLWATETFTGIVIENISKYTTFEMLIGIFIMLITSILSSFVYGEFNEIVKYVNHSVFQMQEKLWTVAEWSRQASLPEDIHKRIIAHFTANKGKFARVISQDFAKTLPLSLRTEVAMVIFQDLILKVKLFNTGNPGFIMAFVRKLDIRMYLQGEIIIEEGTYADEFFIVRHGTVEILATDNETQIALLDSGGFFGEIGILFDVPRTVTVKAFTAVIICYMKKNDLLEVLKDFPKYKDYLIKVASQRSKCRHPEDIDINYDLLDESISSDDSDSSIELQQPKVYTKAEHKFKPFFKRISTVANSNAPYYEFIIDPLSPLYIVWGLIFLLTYSFYLYYIPFTIAFENNGGSIGIAFSIVGYFIYIIDVWVCVNTSLITELKMYTHNKDLILENYSKKYLYYDVISLIPLDIFLVLFDTPQYVSAYFRVFRLFKIRRFKAITLSLLNEINLLAKTLMQVLFFFYLVCHFIGCLYFYISKLQYRYMPETFKKYDSDSVEFLHIKDFFDISIHDQYTSLMYWSSGILSTSCSSSMFPLSTFNKFFSLVLLILSSIFTIFVYAICTKIFYVQNIHYVNFIKKTKTIDTWITQRHFPNELKQRVRSYYGVLWKKSSGYQNDEIFKELPLAVQKDVQMFLFSIIYNCDIFPNDHGALYALIGKCKIQFYSSEETIVHRAEIGLETYFVLEGTIKVVNRYGTIVQKLNKGCYFGEQILFSDCYRCYNDNYISLYESRLAVLPLNSFKQIAELFPDFINKAHSLSAQRTLRESSQSLSESEKLSPQNYFDHTISLSTDLNQTTISENSPDSFVIIKIPKSKRKKYFFIIGKIIYGAIILWNSIYNIYFACFDTYLGLPEIILESLSILVYFSVGIFSAMKYFSYEFPMNDEIKTKKRKALAWTFYHMILAFPVIFLCNYYGKFDLFLVVYSIFRMWCIYFIPKVINTLTRPYVSLYSSLRILFMLLVYMYLLHVFACLFVLVGRSDDHNTWLEMYIGESNYSIYSAAIYWSSSTLSHISFGGTILRTNTEKIYATIVFFIGWFSFCLIFGTICSIILGFSIQMKSHFQESFDYVKSFLKRKKVYKFFKEDIKEYYKYQWNTNKGIQEKQILEDFNDNLRVSSLIFIYEKAIINSQIFNDIHGESMTGVIRSVFKVMKIEIVLPGDALIKVGDRSFDMFYLLKGQVDVVDLEGTKVLATLKTGAHFGEVNILLKNDMRTATIIPTKLCTVGILTKLQLKMLFQAFPYWKSNLKSIAEMRMKKTFNSTSPDDISTRCKGIFSKLQNSPFSYIRYTIRSEKLIAEKIFNTNSMANRKSSIFIYFLHFLLILCSALYLPFHIAFKASENIVLISIEGFIIAESLVFFILNFDISMLKAHNRKKGFLEIIKFYWNTHAFEDIMAFMPFNFLFMLVNNDQTDFFYAFIRLLRIFSIMRLNSLLEIMEFSDWKLAKLIKFSKFFILLTLNLHWNSCFWYYFSSRSSEQSWVEYFDLDNENIWIKYMHSSYFIINMLTVTGHNNIYPTTNSEKIISVILCLLGLSYYSTLYVLMANASVKTTVDIQRVIQQIQDSSKNINKKNPLAIRKRIKEYFTFADYLEKCTGPLHFTSLYSHLPGKLVKHISFQCNRYLLKKLQVFALINSKDLIEKLTLLLEPVIYLKGDFIIYKNDVGIEMYFIVQGSVNILGKDNIKILKTLHKGEYFGEVAIFYDAKRMCSVVANKPSLIYSLKKKDLFDVIKHFPEALGQMHEEAEKRKRESGMINNNLQSVFEEENEEEEIKKQDFKIYSSISNAFLARKESCQVMPVLSGMKNYQRSILKNCEDIVDNISKIHMRRPCLNKVNERRLSQDYPN